MNKLVALSRIETVKDGSRVVIAANTAFEADDEFADEVRSCARAYDEETDKHLEIDAGKEVGPLLKRVNLNLNPLRPGSPRGAVARRDALVLAALAKRAAVAEAEQAANVGEEEKQEDKSSDEEVI